MSMPMTLAKRPPPTASERARRRRYLTATLITCMVVVMVGSAIHVVKLGAGRMDDMRKLATYDLKEETARVRAAGEDITLHETHEAGKAAKVGYGVLEADQLLTKDQWAELDSMIEIPAGAFVMGTDMARADAQDQPAHRVVLPTYWIDKYPVTNAQYARFVAATSRRPPLDWKDGRIPQGELMYPVTMVTWYDASAYAKWAGKRLPAEAEFEKAGRGSDGRRWPWGNKMEPGRLNTYYNVGSATKVNTYPGGASAYGVMDLSGNVDEWTADDFLPYPGSAAAKDMFQGKVAVASGSQDQAMQVADLKPVQRFYKVLRGGSWKGDPFSTSLFHRNFAFPNYASDFFGFRCAGDARARGAKP
jgi:formylglycine-generating enzyme required for sulfatase activity